MRDRFGYLAQSDSIQRNIFIPKYYDPGVRAQVDRARSNHEVWDLGRLIDDGHLSVQSGHDIGKWTYATGNIPFVRTSDLADWELKAQPKQGISSEIHALFAPERQDVAADDLLMVKDGTYLVGTPAYVTTHDLPMLYQSHLLRIRVAGTSPVSSPLLLVLLSTRFVKAQVRARQFSAGIIEKLEGRYREITLALPPAESRSRISEEVRRILYRRVDLREQLKRIPLVLQGIVADVTSPLPEFDIAEIEKPERLGFLRSISHISNAMIPKYYDPSIAEELRSLRSNFDLMTVGHLVQTGRINAATGVEVGKMAYGTGDVPFVRTSDLGSWELRNQAKQLVARELLDVLGEKLDAQPGDILVVRDGTYLVGTSALITEHDGSLLYSGGIYKIRCVPNDYVDPYLLIALLNMPIVRRQILSKRFTRDVIDTLGKRLFEVVLPVPRDPARRKEISELVRTVLAERSALRARIDDIVADLEIL